MTRDCDTTERTVTARTTETEHETTVLDGSVDTAVSPETDDATEVNVRIPDDASQAEVDAITAAVRDHLVATGRLSGNESAETGRWIAAHRLGGVEPDAQTLLDGTDTDPWVAASRANRRW